MLIPACTSGKRIVSHESPVARKKRRTDPKTTYIGDYLCQRCRTLDIGDPSTLLKRRPSAPGPYLGDTRGITTQGSCCLCQLLESIHIAHYTGTARSRRSVRYHLRAFECHRVFKANSSAKASYEQTGVLLGICRAAPKYPLFSELRRCFAKGFVASLPDRISTPHQFHVKKVQPSAADVDAIRAWLHICQRKHSDTCTTKPRNSRVKLKCIDVDDCDGMIPVTMGNDEPYLTFSYVCAEAGDVVHQQAGQIVSQSIQDAMAVTRALGFRYLWIDKFCIDQENFEEKQSAIAKMDSIYEAATMTIIAAPSPDSPPGLPGISRERRMLKQPTVTIGHRTWTSTLPHLSAAIASSAWRTRGWTYQEAVLSTRCLYFTDVQVYFVCQCATACESLAILPNTDLLSLGTSTFRSYPFDIDPTNSVPRREGLNHFFQDLCNYKSRKLTYDKDSLNAFQGILERSNFRNVWGIPMVHCSQDIRILSNSDLALRFVRGLWWENPGHRSYDQLDGNHTYSSLRRIPHFPSWSWCGWSGSITPHKFRDTVNSDDGCNATDETSPTIKIYFETESGLLKNPKQVMLTAPPRLSHVLRVATTFHVIRIRLPTAIHKLPHLCGCSVDIKTCRASHTKVHYVRLFEDPYANHNPSEEFFRRKWHVIRLFTVKRCAGTPDPVSAAFIIDWDGVREHCAEVVGAAYLDHDALDDGAREIIMIR